MILMNQQAFEETLRKYLRNKPFHPFAVELVNGNVITIDQPKLAIGGDSAALITTDDELIEFACEEVRAIRPVPLEAVS